MTSRDIVEVWVPSQASKNKPCLGAAAGRGVGRVQYVIDLGVVLPVAVAITAPSAVRHLGGRLSPAGDGGAAGAAAVRGHGHGRGERGGRGTRLRRLANFLVQLEFLVGAHQGGARQVVLKQPLENENALKNCEVAAT